MTPASHAEHYLKTAVEALHAGCEDRAVLDALPVPVYATDADGQVTYWNRACVAFAGREPAFGQDRWCVTWKIYTTAGEFLPHSECPMAVAIREKRAIRGEIAIAMRPDGSRRAFTPYPTPLFDRDGNLRGAVNMLIDVSDEQAPALAGQAARCRRLARGSTDRAVADMLDAMAGRYDETARALRADLAA